jgi:hypothetical protein
MATSIPMKHKDTGIIKVGYHGFSWTSLFFGFFPALFRADFLTFMGGFVVYVIVGIFTLGLGLFLVAPIWAFMYNKIYTRKLIEKGFVLIGSEGDNAVAAAALGVLAPSVSISSTMNSETKVAFENKSNPTAPAAAKPIEQVESKLTTSEASYVEQLPAQPQYKAPHSDSSTTSAGAESVLSSIQSSKQNRMMLIAFGIVIASFGVFMIFFKGIIKSPQFEDPTQTTSIAPIAPEAQKPNLSTQRPYRPDLSQTVTAKSRTIQQTASDNSSDFLGKPLSFNGTVSRMQVAANLTVGSNGRVSGFWEVTNDPKLAGKLFRLEGTTQNGKVQLKEFESDKVNLDIELSANADFTRLTGQARNLGEKRDIWDVRLQRS